MKKNNEINQNFNSREIAILRNSKYADSFNKLDTEEVVQEALNQFHNYLNEAEVTYLDLDSIELKTILNDYFNNRKPFGTGKKKHEFPDAFNISMLKSLRKKEYQPIYVISGDKDFEDIKGIYLYKSIDELLNLINTDKLIAQQALKYINSINYRFAEEIKEQFLIIHKTSKLTGLIMIVKALSVDMNMMKLSFKMLSYVVIDYNSEEHEIVVALKCLVEIVINCTFFDLENSIWDSDDKEYATMEYGLIKENHNKKIEIVARIHYEYENEDEDSYPEFEVDSIEVDSIEVDTAQKLTQRTLNSKGRQIINYPDLIWENYCPDCGCGLTWENDGGNDFCDKCAPNH
ncbi:PIN domain-containing protein [Facklamia sp. P9177]|uniref:PIN domain-containing protein n=1 Tax=Facklamia sp. P9177 TaxID=3421945 RepID=UPI003D16BBF7